MKPYSSCGCSRLAAARRPNVLLFLVRGEAVGSPSDATFSLAAAFSDSSVDDENNASVLHPKQRLLTVLSVLQQAWTLGQYARVDIIIGGWLWYKSTSLYTREQRSWATHQQNWTKDRNRRRVMVLTGKGNYLRKIIQGRLEQSSPQLRSSNTWEPSLQIAPSMTSEMDLPFQNIGIQNWFAAAAVEFASEATTKQLWPQSHQPLAVF